MAWEVNPGRWLTFGGRCAVRENTVPTSKALPDLSDPYEEARPHRRRHPTVEVHRPGWTAHAPVGPPTPRWTAHAPLDRCNRRLRRSNRGTGVQRGNSGPTNRLNGHVHRHPTAHRHPSTYTTGPSEPGGARTTHTFAPTTPKKASGNAKTGPDEPARTPRHAGLKQHVRAYNP